MKRFLALLLICCCLTSCAFAADAADYTVATKLLKQLAAGSGFSGTLTLEADTEVFSTQKPIVLDLDYIYVRPQDVSLGEHRVDLSLMDGETAVTGAHVQMLNGDLAVQADVISPEWYALSFDQETDVQHSAIVPTALSFLSAFQTTAGMDKNVDAALEAALEAFTTRIDIWIEGYRQSAILDKLEDGTATMQVDYAITPSAVKAEVKQLVFELFNDTAALDALTIVLGEDMADYLSPVYQQWYFDCIDALPLTDDLTISRVVSLKGETLSLSLKLPMYDSAFGSFTLCYDRVKGSEDLPDDNTIAMESENQLITLKYQEYSSMTGVKVTQGTFEREITADFTVSDETVEPFAIAFTLKNEIVESKDADNRDVYACNLSLTLSPVEGDAFEEVEAALASRFVSEERKSAATEISATLTLSSADEAIELTLEGASRKKWDPEIIPAPLQPDWNSLLPGAGVRTLAALSDFLALPEGSTND
ncbi:MAG: hypothetical protein J6K55_05545 [Clostridia bacterium]|nr:hypothetical protein [Clostridia bacterium]